MKKERELAVNILIFICVVASMLFVPTLLQSLLAQIIKNEMVVAILSQVIYIALLFLVFYKDLIKEAKIFKKDYKKCIKTGFKYYLVGIGIMIVSNLIIGVLLKGGISENETLVREILFKFPIYSFITIVFIGPISEELVFRKAPMSISNNKYIYSLICGLFFGLAHIVTVDFSLFDLLYVIPYGALGFVFGYMNYETKTTFTSISMHTFHNLITYLLLLFINSMGVI